MSIHDQANLHALRYANEAAKVFLMQQYQQAFPHLFDHALLETRPATPADYYVPPALAQKAIVVVGTRFEETACLRLSCFPFKDNWDLCGDRDPPQWVQTGRSFELACQPSCQDHTLNTEWVRGKCVLANPIKKVVATMPEKLFDRAYRHIYHGGLDVVDGHLRVNKLYCEAYGLTFAGDECRTATGQSFLEWFTGKTAVRAAKTAHVQPHTMLPPPLPAYLQYQAPPKKKKKKRRKRAAGPASMTVQQELYREVALEMLEEVGEEVTEWAVRSFLLKKAPGLLITSVNRIAAKLVIKHSMAEAIKRVGLATLRAAGKGVGVVTTIYAVFELVVSIVDIIDPCDFDKVLSKEDLEKIDRAVDYHYFKDTPVRPELTPEYLWERNILMKEESDKFNFQVDKVQEYLTALNAAPSTPERERAFKKAKLEPFVWVEEEVKQWNRKLFTSLGFVAACVLFLFIEWIDFWATLLLFVKLYFRI